MWWITESRVMSMAAASERRCWKNATDNGASCIGIRARLAARPLPRQVPQRSPDEEMQFGNSPENENEQAKEKTKNAYYEVNVNISGTRRSSCGVGNKHRPEQQWQGRRGYFNCRLHQ